MTHQLRAIPLFAALITFSASAEAAPLRVELGTLGGDETYPADMNGRGQIVGCSRIRTGEWRAFVWEVSTGMVELPVRATESCATAINDGGQVVGYAGGASSEFAFLWDAGAVTNLGPGAATAINDVGQVLGGDPSGGWIWEAGVMRWLPIPFGWFVPVSINDGGRAVGNACEVDHCVPLVYDLGYDPVRVTELAFGRANETAWALNARGQVLVGSMGTDEHGVYLPANAYLWSDGSTVAIPSLLSDGVFAGYGGRPLNDRGEVVGTSSARDGTVHGFLWDGAVLVDLGPDFQPEVLNEVGQVGGIRWSHGATASIWDSGGFTDIGYADLTSNIVRLNARGDAVAHYWDSAGRIHAFAWLTSVPEDVAGMATVADALAHAAATGAISGATLDAFDALNDAAAAQLASGNACAAARILGALQHKLDSLVRTGRVSVETGDAVSAAVADAIAAIGAC